MGLSNTPIGDLWQTINRSDGAVDDHVLGQFADPKLGVRVHLALNFVAAVVLVNGLNDYCALHLQLQTVHSKKLSLQQSDLVSILHGGFELSRG